MTKHWRYNAPLFDDYNDEISNGSNIYRYCPEPNLKVEHLYYKTNVIEENEIEQLGRTFPSLTAVRVDAENILQMQLNFKNYGQLNRVILGVSASEEYAGIIDEEEDDPDYKFGL